MLMKRSDGGSSRVPCSVCGILLVDGLKLGGFIYVSINVDNKTSFRHQKLGVQHIYKNRSV